MSTLLQVIDDGILGEYDLQQDSGDQISTQHSCFNSLVFKKMQSPNPKRRRAKEDCLLADRGYSRRIDWIRGAVIGGNKGW